jgi:hypothetical protein
MHIVRKNRSLTIVGASNRLFRCLEKFCDKFNQAIKKTYETQITYNLNCEYIDPKLREKIRKKKNNKQNIIESTDDEENQSTQEFINDVDDPIDFYDYDVIHPANDNVSEKSIGFEIFGDGKSEESNDDDDGESLDDGSLRAELDERKQEIKETSNKYVKGDDEIRKMLTDFQLNFNAKCDELESRFMSFDIDIPMKLADKKYDVRAKLAKIKEKEYEEKVKKYIIDYKKKIATKLGWGSNVRELHSTIADLQMRLDDVLEMSKTFREYIQSPVILRHFQNFKNNLERMRGVAHPDKKNDTQDIG